MLNITHSALRRRADSGKISYLELPSGHRRYRIGDATQNKDKTEDTSNAVSERQTTDQRPPMDEEDGKRYVLRSVRYRARLRGIDFNLEPEDISIPERCPVLGIPIAVRQRGISDSSASLDRVNPKKGYVKGNVKIISWEANRLKSNCTDPAKLRAIADYIEENK